MADIPPRALLKAALYRITETLAAELAAPTRSPPQWSDADWRIAMAVAAMHGVSALLSTRLGWRGPAPWTGFLESQRIHTEMRHARIEALLCVIDRQLGEQGIPAVALKGAALHALGLYVRGERPMADIDLLVRPPDDGPARHLLLALGLRESAVTWRERVFEPTNPGRPVPLGEHAANAVKVELHARVCERLPLRIHDLSDRVFPPRARPGLNPYGSRASLLRHLTLHAAGAMVTRTLRLLHLHDIALLSARLSEAEWDEFLVDGGAGRRWWWAWGPLQLTERYYGPTAPRPLIDALARSCPRTLRRTLPGRTLTDVSCSSLEIAAFPGLEWSESAALKLGYLLRRVRPSAASAAERRHDARNAGWAAGSDWPALSQGWRIARWIAARPTRPATMHAVQAAFACGSPQD